TPSTDPTRSRSLRSTSEGSSKDFAPFGSTQKSAGAWSIMVVTIRLKPRNRPICSIMRTTEKTIPTSVAMKRSRSCNRLRDARISDSDIEQFLSVRICHRARYSDTGMAKNNRLHSGAAPPTHRQRASEDNGCLADRMEISVEDGELKPNHDD